jgi:hypothetical protein
METNNNNGFGSFHMNQQPISNKLELCCYEKKVQVSGNGYDVSLPSLCQCNSFNETLTLFHLKGDKVPRFRSNSQNKTHKLSMRDSIWRSWFSRSHFSIPQQHFSQNIKNQEPSSVARV